MEADNSKEKEWEKRGGTIVSTTDSKGRVRRTFVNSDGEKFKSWKECEHYLAYTDAYGGAEKASHESQSAEHKANSAMKRSTVSGASAEKDSTESNKNKAAMEKEKKVVNDNNKTGSGKEETKIEDKEEEGIKKQQSKVNETAGKNSNKSAGKVEMEIKPNKPTDKVTSSAKKTVKKPSKEDEVAVKSGNNKANKEDTKVERNKSEEENTSNGKKIMKDKKGNGSNTKKEQKDTDIESDTDQKEAKEENESNDKKIAKGKKGKGNKTKKEEKDTDIKPDKAKEAANDNANTPKSKKKESNTAGSGKEKTKNTSKSDGNSKRNTTDADVVSRRGKTKGNDAKDNKKKEESEANDRKQMTKESPGSGKKRKKENESAENSEKKRNRDEMDARDCSKKKTRPEHESKRKLPKRAAACDDFKAVSAFRLTKSDFVKGSKKEKVEDNENDAVEMTETSENVYGGIVQRRLTDFIVHDSDGNSQSIEMSEVTDLFITGAILPMDEVGTAKRVRCEGFGRVDSWSITGYEEGVPTIWFATECAEYMCLKPNSHYKKYFDMFFEKAALCVEVYRALSKPDGGDPLLGFDEMVARVARSLNGKKNSGGRSFGKDYIISHGEFVSKQLIALDKNSKGADQLFTGLPALVTLESEGKKVDNLNNNNLRASSNRGIIISENVSSLSPLMSAAEDVMDEDEKLARLLQEEENWKSSKYQQRSSQPKKKCYIKINEKEIANDYPMPAFYKPTEDETDEYLFFDDAPTDAEELPRRMLHDWTLYNAESRLVPLELLPMSPDTESDIDIFGSGIMTEDDGSGYCLEGDVEGSQSSSKADHPQGIRIYLSAIKEWMIEFGASMLFISVRTDGAWYRLGNPSRQYFPWYQPVLKTARVAIKIITMLKDESRVSKLSFSDVIRKLTEQARKEPTFIANNVEDVERYIVVHGQIILQQFAEYPDDLIRRSAFITGLTVKMEQRQHTKLFHTKTTIIIKEKNLNPRASFAVDTSKADASRRKQMHATTTKLIYGIWKDYYTCSASASNVPDENEAKEIVEQEDQEQSDEEDEVVVVTENKFNVPSQVKVKRGKSAKTSEWIGKSTGKLPSGEPLYRKALANGIPIAVGGAITVESYGAEDLTVILLIEYMFESSDGAKTLHGRFLERACQTVLGNAADDREVFLTMNCSDLALDCVKDSVPLNVRVRPWGTNYRKENAAADECERAEAKESEKKQIPSGYYCKSLYAPEKGAFLTLPLDTLGLGTGQCHGCSETKNDKEFELFESEDGFTFKGIDYHLQDFVYIDPAEFQPYGEVKEIEKFKGGMSKGLRAYVICQIININAGSAQKNDAKSTKILVRRFFRPEDIAPEKAYHADVNEVYYSQETSTVFISSIQGRCDVKRQQYYAGNASFPTFDHTFWCNCVFDPSKGTVKQLPVNVKLSSSGTSASPDGNAHASNKTAKAKGKGILDETTENAKADNTDSRLATLDIFAGCGGLSLGLQQSGACLTKWAIEYEQPAAEAFKLNHPEAEVFCDNCNVILRAIMEKSGDEAECISTAEATDKASKLSDEQRKALPVPGQVDFINGGPPCQGFSGMNRFNMTAWSKVQCEMILGFLSYADYFRPKYFLLENVRNFVSFNKGQTFRLTLRSLLDMGYQVRFGVLQAGNYGISQSRKRAFIWAASPDELLPEWPEPMHVFASSQIKISLPGAKQYAAVKDAAAGAPFRTITVRDTIGDLPPIANGADEQEMQYQNDPVSWFQKQIRGDHGVLYDHISKEMNELNLIRCQRIPKRPGADWRDLPEEKVKLSTGQLVDLIPWCLPNTADRHNQWKGLFGRLDWEGNFSTSVTDPQPMGKVGMCFHPEQDRIVTVRECARSQGFPDNFKFCGNILHKHRQIGNAVPPPLAAALGIKLKEAVDAKKSQ